jgi:hypothetical protein
MLSLAVRAAIFEATSARHGASDATTIAAKANGGDGSGSGGLQQIREATDSAGTGPNRSSRLKRSCRIVPIYLKKKTLSESDGDVKRERRFNPQSRTVKFPDIQPPNTEEAERQKPLTVNNLVRSIGVVDAVKISDRLPALCR